MDKNEKQKILIVDDERSNIMVLNHILKQTYSTLVAISGQTAIEIAKENKPDLILLDIIMPDMTGFEVLYELKRSEITRKIPVIFITGLDNVTDEETGFNMGAVDYITKPFYNSIVLARVKMHIQMAAYIKEIETFGMTDPLTNIPNRRSFNLRMDIEWKRAQRENETIGLLIIDVDHFKNFNDTYGHTQGDVLLKTIADVFTKTIKRSLDFVARWGGEEFVVVLPNTAFAGAMEVAERIRVNVQNQPIPLASGVSAHITVSIGLCVEQPVNGSDYGPFIDKADRAMYNAKESGRNKVCYL